MCGRPSWPLPARTPYQTADTDTYEHLTPDATGRAVEVMDVR
ncbi:hypothetical protein AB0N14_23295 [Streptomyces sp. NPDC051104]